MNNSLLGMAVPKHPVCQRVRLKVRRKTVSSRKIPPTSSPSRGGGACEELEKNFLTFSENFGIIIIVKKEKGSYL